MGPSRNQDQGLRRPFDVILGAKSQVRVARVLERVRESMTVREAARRTDEHLRAVQIAVKRLVESGVARRIGTGRQRLVQWNPDHPLARAMSALFEAERERYDRVVESLAELARSHASPARSVWMVEQPDVGGPRIEVGILSRSNDVDRLVDSLREGVVPLMRSEDLAIDVRGWTLPDLELSPPPLPSSLGHVTLLWGLLPWEVRGQDTEPSAQRKSHQMIDDELRERAARLASVLRQRPELIRLAREEVVRRIERSPKQEARTLREWQNVLEGMSLSKLVRWLVDGGEQATRLRQSMPLVWLRAVREGSSGERRDEL